MSKASQERLAKQINKITNHKSKSHLPGARPEMQTPPLSFSNHHHHHLPISKKQKPKKKRGRRQSPTRTARATTHGTTWPRRKRKRRSRCQVPISLEITFAPIYFSHL